MPFKLISITTYLLVVVFYCAFYAPYGLENNDGGFILGLAYQFAKGADIYKEIIYVRPPLSIILHSINFLPPLSFAPVLSSRIIFFLEIATYSALASMALSRLFSFSRAGTLAIALASFAFNAHNFPAMAWHTVDGVFFSILSLFLASKRSEKWEFSLAFFAFLLAFAAAMSKQPFYLTPIICAVMLIDPSAPRSIFKVLASAAGAAFIFFAALYSFIDLQMMLGAISSETRIQDLIAAGFTGFAADIRHNRTIIAAIPLGAYIVYFYKQKLFCKDVAHSKRAQLLFWVATALFLAGIIELFLSKRHWTHASSLIDTFFLFSAAISALQSIKLRSRSWFILTLSHVISWAASISWGYTTVSLFSTPMIITYSIVARDVFRHNRFAPVFTVTALLVTFFAFFIGNRYLYSLSGPVRRADARIEMGNHFPALRGIVATPKEASEYQQLADISAEFGPDVAVLPNWPLYNLVFGIGNPIGIDWLLNAEVGPFKEVVRKRMEKLDYAIVFRDASPNPADSGKFGSSLTNWVTSTWDLQTTNTEYFDVYANPRKKLGVKFN